MAVAALPADVLTRIGRSVFCVCIVSRQNAPLYMRHFGHEDHTTVEMAAFSSLDVIDEKLGDTSGRKVEVRGGDPFIGVLGVFDAFKIFAYVPSSRVKFIVIARDVPMVQGRVRDLMRAMHLLYVDALCSPFASVDGRVSSTRFDDALVRLLGESADKLEFRG